MQVEKSPFAERLVRRGYEVLYLTEAVDEYCLSSLPEYDGKKFQNIAKEIFDLEESQYPFPVFSDSLRSASAGTDSTICVSQTINRKSAWKRTRSSSSR